MSYHSNVVDITYIYYMEVWSKWFINLIHRAFHSNYLKTQMAKVQDTYGENFPEVVHAEFMLDYESGLKLITIVPVIEGNSNTSSEVTRTIIRDIVKNSITVHSGVFHADEVASCVVLRLTHEFSNYSVIRTRIPEIIKGSGIVADVGYIFDHETKRYDHHQRSFIEVFGYGHSHKLSSFGLIWKYYGKAVVKNLLLGKDDYKQLDITPDLINSLRKKIYSEYIASIDAIDNGDRELKVKSIRGDRETANLIDGSNISSKIRQFNTNWWDNSPDSQSNSFMRAYNYFKTDFLHYFDSAVRKFLIPEGKIDNLLEDALNLHQTYHLLPINTLILSQYFPFEKSIWDYEKSSNEVGRFIYVIFPDADSGTYRILCVKDEVTGKSRKLLPEKIRGESPQNINKIIDIEDSVFCHAGGFIGGTRSRVSAIRMACYEE